MKIENSKGMNIQLFADGDQQGGTSEQAEPITSQAQDPAKANETMISKSQFDALASELAKAKKETKALQDKGKTDEQLKAEVLAEKERLIEEREAKIKELTIKSNKAIANSNVSEIKAKLALDPKATEFDTILGALISEDENLTVTRSTSFSKLLNSIYEKGFNDARQNGYNSLTSGIKGGQEGSKESGFAKFQKETLGKTNNEEIKF